MVRRLAVCLLFPVLLLAQESDSFDDMPVVKAIPARSKVSYAMDSRSLVGGFTPNAAVVRGMVEAVVMAVTRQPNIAAAWRSLVAPTDTVGIKVAAAPGSLSGTHPAVVTAISLGLQEAGVPADRIIVWDRNREDLLVAGYSENDPNYRLAWIDPVTGYDREAMLTAPVLGRLIWGDSRFGDIEGTRLVDRLSNGTQLSSTSFFTEVLSKRVTKVINVPSLCDSFMCGLNGAIANMTLWNVDNWRRFIKEPNYGDPYLAEIYADPIVREKVVLTILDALTLQFAGGPFPDPNFVRQNFSIYGSLDPVAIDGTSLRMLEEYRKANKLPPITPTAGHIQSADAMGLGNAAAATIDIVRVGSQSRE